MNNHLKQTESKVNKDEKRTMIWIWISASLILAAMIVWALIASFVIRITEYEASDPLIPESFDGYKIVFVSDLHDRYFDSLAKETDKLSPNAVMFGGDINTKDENNETFFKMLSYLASKYDVFMTEGNHDINPDTSDNYAEYAEKIKSTGTILLQGQAHVLERNGESISISGAEWYSYGLVTPQYSDGKYNVFIMHDPEAFDTVERRPELMLSGHVHGGFIRIFGKGFCQPGAHKSLMKLDFKKAFFPKYCEGEYASADGRSRLFVSVGMGFSGVPFRLIRPEIVVVTLKRR